MAPDPNRENIYIDMTVELAKVANDILAARYNARIALDRLNALGLLTTDYFTVDIGDSATKAVLDGWLSDYDVTGYQAREMLFTIQQFDNLLTPGLSVDENDEHNAFLIRGSVADQVPVEA
jgi:hypothetical protein